MIKTLKISKADLLGCKYSPTRYLIDLLKDSGAPIEDRNNVFDPFPSWRKVRVFGYLESGSDPLNNELNFKFKVLTKFLIRRDHENNTSKS